MNHLSNDSFQDIRQDQPSSVTLHVINPSGSQMMLELSCTTTRHNFLQLDKEHIVLEPNSGKMVTLTLRIPYGIDELVTFLADQPCFLEARHACIELSVPVADHQAPQTVPFLVRNKG